jgi:hypothetical protein
MPRDSLVSRRGGHWRGWNECGADLGFEGKRASGKLLERCSADPRRSGGTGGVMATRESNVIMFPQPIGPERKEDIRIAECPSSEFLGQAVD